MRRITLCADDFGQSSQISEGILRLARAKRISAISSFTLLALWKDYTQELKALHSDVDLGIHLTYPLTLSGILQQIDTFVTHMGFLPDFLDGHRHVHAYGKTPHLLLKAITARWQNQPKPYVRAPDRLGSFSDGLIKGLILKTLCFGFSNKLRQADIPFPPWFGGLYNLHSNQPYRPLFLNWISHCPDQSLIMCHPGLNLYDDPSDPIHNRRALEYAYLASDQFLEDCKRYEITISRFDLTLLK